MKRLVMRLVLADDHVLLLDALQAYLKGLEPDVEVITATDFDQALQHVTRSAGLDLVLLDLNMPGMNGLEGLRIMKQRFPNLPVVLLSGNAGAKQIREAMSCGAAGFIPKDLPGEALVRALELVLAGSRYVPMLALSESPAEGTDLQSHRFRPGNPLRALTPREFEVLTILVHGYSNKEIAADLGLKEVTVAFHLKSVFRKLKVSSRTEAVTTGIRYGLTI